MVEVRNEGIILEKSEAPFENQAVLNPACIDVDGVTHMFYRAVRKEGMVSTIGYCQMVDNKVVMRSPKPILAPEFDYEKGGVEDPRIVFLDGVYYLFYTAFDEKNALIAYATSSDLKTFTKRGLISE
ncbi:MAG: pesticidal protein Cry7Aa, partial [Patescibacteria group bacterium]